MEECHILLFPPPTSTLAYNVFLPGVALYLLSPKLDCLRTFDTISQALYSGMNWDKPVLLGLFCYILMLFYFILFYFASFWFFTISFPIGQVPLNPQQSLNPDIAQFCHLEFIFRIQCIIMTSTSASRKQSER